MSDPIHLKLDVTALRDVRQRHDALTDGRAGGKVTVQIDALDGQNLPCQLTLSLSFISLLERERQQSLPEYHETGPPYRCRVDTATHRVERLVSRKRGMEFDTEVVVTVRHTVRVCVQVLRGVKVLALLNAATGTTVVEGSRRIQAGLLSIDLEVVALQDGARLPVSGAPLEPGLMHPTYRLGEDDIAPLTGLRGLACIVARHVPNGVDLTWPATGQVVSLRLLDPADGVSGFAFALNERPALPQQQGGQFACYDDVLHLQLCGRVQVGVSMPEFLRENFFGDRLFPDPIEWQQAGSPEVAHPTYRVWMPGDGWMPVEPTPRLPAYFRPVAASRFYRVQRVGSLDELPLPGVPFHVAERDDVAAAEFGTYLEKGASIRPWLELGVDLGLGAIPIVGDIVDFADFNLALATGRDKWGHEVDDVDLLLMGLAVIPIFGTAFAGARKGARVLR